MAQTKRVIKQILQLAFLLLSVGVIPAIAFWAVDRGPSLRKPDYKPIKFNRAMWGKNDVGYRINEGESLRNRMSDDVVTNLTPFGMNESDARKLLGEPEQTFGVGDLVGRDGVLGGDVMESVGDPKQVVKALSYEIVEGPESNDNSKSVHEIYLAVGFDKNKKLCWKGKLFEGT